MSRDSARIQPGDLCKAGSWKCQGSEKISPTFSYRSAEDMHRALASFHSTFFLLFLWIFQILVKLLFHFAKTLDVIKFLLFLREVSNKRSAQLTIYH